MVGSVDEGGESELKRMGEKNEEMRDDPSSLCSPGKDKKGNNHVVYLSDIRDTFPEVLCCSRAIRI